VEKSKGRRGTRWRGRLVAPIESKRTPLGLANAGIDAISRVVVDLIRVV
jgi:hypothetical protein|tara:strand:- start:180 stop:326 length:147 start_codon:yes stop_codon:yes gene_type:complete